MLKQKTTLLLLNRNSVVFLQKEFLCRHSLSELVIIFYKANNAFYNAKNAWNTCPRKQEVNHTCKDIAHVKLMDAKSTEQDTQYPCNNFTFHNRIFFIWFTLDYKGKNKKLKEQNILQKNISVLLQKKFGGVK